MLAHEYGWTFDTIASLSLREVEWSINRINKRRKRDLKLKASLHGKQLNIPVDEKDGELDPLTKEEEDMVAKQLERTFREKKNRRG